MRLAVIPPAGVLFFRGFGFISSVIRWQTWSPVAHCGIYFRDEMIESWHNGGVRIVPNPIWNRTESDPTIEAYFVPDSQKNIQAFLAAKKWVGKQYDFNAIVGFATRVDTQDREKLFCSELVMEAYKKTGLELLSRIPSEKVSPGQLRTSPLLRPIKLSAEFGCGCSE